VVHDISPQGSSGLAAILFLLKRYLISSWTARGRRVQATVGVALPVFGIAVGVCAFTVVLSVMGGFVQGLKKRLLGVEPHIEIVVREGFGRVPARTELLDRISKISSDVVAVSPFLKTDVIVQSSRKPMTVVLWGVDPRRAEAVMKFENYISTPGVGFSNLERDAFELSDELESEPSTRPGSFPTLLAGEKALEILSAEVGHRLTLISTQPDEGLAGMAPTQQPVIVEGTFLTGSVTHDSKVVFARLGLVQKFLNAPDEWSGVQVLLDEPLEAERVAGELNAALEAEGLRAKPWTESNKALLKALRLERWGMSFVLYMVILVGCFSITITLVLAVRRKAREMAILRSIGLRRIDLGLLYLCKGGSIGLIGVVVGLISGLMLLQVVSRVPLSILEDAYPGKGLPVLVSWADLVAVSLGSIVLSIVAAVWPALEVMRIDPVETLSDRGA
jgi:lipoprotein-releasing system permease protein